MSKRGAEEYITKDHGSTPNVVSDGSKVKMATAAQLAKRKMAVPKSRAGRTGQSPVPSAGTSNPFAGTNQFGAPQNNQQQTFSNPGGITFGASQSFPSGDASSSNGFTFSVPGQSNSFTFGQTTPNNPFAHLNGDSSNDSPQGQDSNDTIMESPQKKPALGSSLFGSNSGNNESKPASSGFAFSQPAGQPSSQPLFSFGQSQGFGTTQQSPLFGQSISKPVDAGSAPSMFGQSSQAQSSAPTAPTLFGQSTSAPQELKPSSGFSFSQPSTSASSSAPTIGFSQPLASSTTTTTSSTKSTFNFGQSQSHPAVSSTPFGTASQPEPSEVGSSAPASVSGSSTPLFGSAPTGSTNNLFGGFGNPKSADVAQPAKTDPASEPSKSAHSGSAPASAAPEPAKVNPFAGLFAQHQPTEATTSTAETAKPLFNFASPAQPSGLFAAPKSANADSTSKPAENSPKKALFSFGPPSVSNLGSSAPSKPAGEPFAAINPFASLSNENAKSADGQPSQPLFGFGKPYSTSGTTHPQSMPAFEGSPSVKSLSASNSSAPGVFGGFSTLQQSESLNIPTEPSIGQNSLNQTPSPSITSNSAFLKTKGSTKPASESFLNSSSLTKTVAPVHNSSSSNATSNDVSDGPKRSVNTHPPTRIPPFLSGDEYKAYDSNYRLHSLNREFQKRIASLDPSRDDFENIIHHYVAARESIGESIGLQARNLAGMKRKADDGDDRHDDDSLSSKRNKPDEGSPSKPTFGSSSTSSSVFKPVPSSTPKSAATSTNADSVKATPSNSNVSSLFNSMIPDSKKATSASNNPFANLAQVNNTNMGTVSDKPVFTFGGATGAAEPVGSTTPTKSPPKKPAFEMPNFGALAGGKSFMDAFKQKSDASAAKFAKEAREKRKAEEFDSDEDDEDEWNRKYEEEERAKKEKLQTIAQTGFKPVFGNGITSGKPAFGFGTSSNNSSAAPKPATGFTFGSTGASNTTDKTIEISDNSGSAEEDEDEGSEDTEDAEGDDADGEAEEETEEDDLPEDGVNGDDENDDDEEDFETALARSRGQGKSLFDRITPNPSVQKDSMQNGSITPSIEKDTFKKSSAVSNLFAKGTPEAPSFSPLTPTAAKEPYVPSKTFTFTPTPPTTASSPMPGASIFAGGIMKDGPIAGEGLFGSRPSTPSNADKTKTNLFSGLGTPAASGPSDHTWKKGSEIKFGSSNGEAPTLSITEPSPQKQDTRPFANLFGANSSGPNSTTSNTIGFSFGQSPAPGFLSATSHLAGGSGTASGISSRATSPGTTDNESVATNEEDFSNDTQVSLMETRPGEENETVIYEARARAMRFYNEEQIKGTKLVKGWNTVGLGPARLLRHRETGKTRLVMRAEPGANIILNTNLQPAVKYEYAATGNAGTVKFTVAANDGMQGWLLKVKTTSQAEDLAKLMEANKTAKS